MVTFLRLCWWAYDCSLRLYPADLREAFAAEMSEIFRRQTLDGWRADGWPGLLPVLGWGAKEFFTEGLCVRAASPELMAGALSLLCTSATFVCLLWALQNPLGVKAAGDRLHDLLWNGGRPTATALHHHSRRQ